MANHDIKDVISTSNAFLWTQVESCVAIICICLPTLRGPLGRLMPTIFGSLSSRNTKNSYNLEGMDRNKSASHNWKGDERIFGQRGQRSQRSNTDTKTDWDETSSQERIIGVTKTVDVEITNLSDAKNLQCETTAGKEMFRIGK
jgi:hypothetical protein